MCIIIDCSTSFEAPQESSIFETRSAKFKQEIKREKAKSNEEEKSEFLPYFSHTYTISEVDVGVEVADLLQV